MKIAVIGTGYVGLVSGSCLAELGHDIICLDIDHSKILKLQKGVIPIYEPDLEDIISRNNHRLSFSTDMRRMDEADVIIIAVGTPSSEAGEADLTYVYKCANSISEHTHHNQTIFIKSTVPVGTSDKLRQYFNDKFNIVSNPEFLREGKAVNDFLYPDRIVLGAKDEMGHNIALKVYNAFPQEKIILTNNVSAELIKYASNAYLAMRIAYINEISDLAEATGANIKSVTQGLQSDHRIGKHFLKVGPGFGGSCFPKDTTALLNVAGNYNIDLSIVHTVIESNIKRKTKLAYRILSSLDNSSDKITILGATFKAETDDIRSSAAIDIIKILLEADCKVIACDPQGLEQLSEIFQDQIKYEEDPYTALSGCDAAVILTEWVSFRNLDWSRAYSLMHKHIIFDFRNLLDRATMQNKGFLYRSLGNHA